MYPAVFLKSKKHNSHVFNNIIYIYALEKVTLEFKFLTNIGLHNYCTSSHKPVQVSTSFPSWSFPPVQIESPTYSYS